MYRYIGNKSKLLPYIIDKIRELIGDSGTVADIMAGTGSVALGLRKNGYKVIASDMMTYSYHHLVVNLLLNESPSFVGIREVSSGNGTAYENVAQYLNTLPPVKGFFTMSFLQKGNHQLVLRLGSISPQKMLHNSCQTIDRLARVRGPHGQINLLSRMSDLHKLIKNADLD